MPDFLVSPFDKFHHPHVKPAEPALAPNLLEKGTCAVDAAKLPRSGFQATLRGARNRCPSCDEVPLFARFLKPVNRCTACGQDWTAHQADDFLAYVAILLTGHLMAPLIIALVNHTNLPMWAMMVLILSSASMIMMALLQPAKGAIIAVQWWLGMHGFVKPDQNSSKIDTTPEIIG